MGIIWMMRVGKYEFNTKYNIFSHEPYDVYEIIGDFAYRSAAYTSQMSKMSNKIASGSSGFAAVGVRIPPWAVFLR